MVTRLTRCSMPWTVGTRRRWAGTVLAWSGLGEGGRREQTVGAGRSRREGDDDPDEAGEREHERDAAVGADAEPVADPVGTAAVGHERDEHRLGEWRHEERCERRGR